MSIVFLYKQLNVKTVELNAKTVLFQAIQFSIRTQFSSIWPIDRALFGAHTQGHCGPGSDGNEEVFHIPQSSSITGDLPSVCLVSYLWQSLGEFYPSAEMQSVYSTAQLIGPHFLMRLGIYIYMTTILLGSGDWGFKSLQGMQWLNAF